MKCHLQYSIDKMATWAAYDGSIVDLDDCTDNRVYFRADPENPNTDGFHKEDYQKMFGSGFEKDFAPAYQKLLQEGLLEESDRRIRLTSKGLDQTNPVMEALLNV